MCRKNCNERHLFHCPHHKRQMRGSYNPFWPHFHDASSMKSLSWHTNQPQTSSLRSWTLCLCLSANLPGRNVHTSTKIKAIFYLTFLYHLWGAFGVINLSILTQITVEPDAQTAAGHWKCIITVTFSRRIALGTETRQIRWDFQSPKKIKHKTNIFRIEYFK